MPSPTSPRNPLARARFLLAHGEALPGTEQEAFDTYLQAAIVFGRSTYQYLQSLDETAGAAPSGNRAERPARSRGQP